MVHRITVALAALLLTIASSAPAVAEVLDMPGEQRLGDALERPATPVRGMSKAAVQRRYGEPTRRVAAVGEPPISRWVYDDFVVVFEHHLVLHSVVPQAPAPIYHADQLRPAH